MCCFIFSHSWWQSTKFIHLDTWCYFYHRNYWHIICDKFQSNKVLHVVILLSWQQCSCVLTLPDKIIQCYSCIDKALWSMVNALRTEGLFGQTCTWILNQIMLWTCGVSKNLTQRFKFAVTIQTQQAQVVNVWYI